MNSPPPSRWTWNRSWALPVADRARRLSLTAAATLAGSSGSAPAAHRARRPRGGHPAGNDQLISRLEDAGQFRLESHRTTGGSSSSSSPTRAGRRSRNAGTPGRASRSSSPSSPGPSRRARRRPAGARRASQRPPRRRPSPRHVALNRPESRRESNSMISRPRHAPGGASPFRSRRPSSPSPSPASSRSWASAWSTRSCPRSRSGCTPPPARPRCCSPVVPGRHRGRDAHHQLGVHRGSARSGP